MDGTTSDDDMLKDEYFHIQKAVDDFDRRVLTIKAWRATLSMAGIGAAFTQKMPDLLWMSGVSGLAFWMVETLWKSFQSAFYPRLTLIEAHWRDRSAPIDVLQTNTAWMAAYDGFRTRDFLRFALFPHVALPHVLVALVGIGLFAVNSGSAVYFAGAWE